MFTVKKLTSLLIITTLLLSNLPAISMAAETEELEESQTLTLVSKDGEQIDLFESTASDSPVLTQLESESEVLVMGESSGFIHIQFISPDGSEIWEGYVKSENILINEELLNKAATEEPSTEVEEQAEEVKQEEPIAVPEETPAAASANEPAAQLTGEALSGIAINAPTKTYASPSTDAQVIKSYTAGTVLKFYDYSTSWYKAKVKANGTWQKVYIQKSAVETVITTPTQIEAVAKLNSTAMYKTPSTSAKIIKSYKQGSILKLYTYTASWYKARVKVNGTYQTAYVPTTSVELAGLSNKVELAIAVKNPTSVFAYVSTGAKALKTYTAGSILKVYNYTSDWYRATIYLNGTKQTGYIPKNYLESVAEGSAQQNGIAQKSPTKVYKNPAVTAETLKTYKKNSILKYYAYSANWYVTKVKVNGTYQTGYINRNDISSQKNTSYELTLDEAVSMQMKMSPVTDKMDSKALNADLLYASVPGRSTSWLSATTSQVREYLDPANYSPGSKEYYQFLILSSPAGTSASEINTNILSGKGVLAGKASSFIQAASTNNINEVYLISHALLETGNGSSSLATGIKYNGTTVYNMYGIGAYDSDPINGGAKYAYEQGWTSVDKAIIGGAAFVAKSYINAGQDTLYKMRWNPESMSMKGYASHQYATDIGWAVKQTARMAQIYDLLTQYTLLYDIPVYKR